MVPPTQTCTLSLTHILAPSRCEHTSAQILRSALLPSEIPGLLPPVHTGLPPGGLAGAFLLSPATGVPGGHPLKLPSHSVSSTRALEAGCKGTVATGRRPCSHHHLRGLPWEDAACLGRKDTDGPQALASKTAALTTPKGLDTPRPRTRQAGPRAGRAQGRVWSKAGTSNPSTEAGLRSSLQAHALGDLSSPLGPGGPGPAPFSPAFAKHPCGHTH